MVTGQFHVLMCLITIFAKIILTLLATIDCLRIKILNREASYLLGLIYRMQVLVDFGTIIKVA